jgi:TonB-linked SusC/RagA family outer membrane protein
MQTRFSKPIALLCIIVLSSFSLSAQKTVRGIVLDEEGFTLPGATIMVENTTIGVTTGLDGDFILELPEGQHIVIVSFMGYEAKRVSFEDRDFAEIVLSPALARLEEFVITALGIKREAKALGYSVQQVEGEALGNTNRMNPLSGLMGQVAGLQIGSSGSGAGGSSKILIRGANSLTGSNDPLFVVDGVPIDNSGGSSGGLFGGFDYGNAINNINLDDIESISVLKGGAASALYGARGQNGVIMITTKSGSQTEGIGITYQFITSMATPLIQPEFQTNYAQGSGGNFGPLNPRSWGEKMDGNTIINFLNQEQTLMPASSHPYDEFFQTSTNMDHSLSLDKRGDTNGVLFSASWNQSEGMLPDNEVDRKSFNLRYDSKLADFLVLDARANYIHQETHNRPNLAGSPDNPIYLMTMLPASVSLEQLENYQTVTGLPVVWTSEYEVNPDGSISLPEDATPDFATSPLLQNPYWATSLNTNRDLRNRIMGFVSLSLDMKKLFDLNFDLELTTKAGVDFYNDERERITAHNTYYKAEGRATGNFSRLEIMEGNYDFLLTAGQQWGKFTARGSVGGNIMQRKYRGLTASSESGLINEHGPYVIQNFLNPIANNGLSDIEIHSLYALLSTDYRRMIFLDFTVRNDWTSVLAPEVWSYLYPSVSASWLLEESFTLPASFDMLKIRASFAGVGSGGSVAGQRYFQYGTTPNQFHGLPYGFINAFRPEPNLKSEYTVSQEVGLELIMFGNRLNADIALYQTGTRDQIFRNPLAPSSGFSSGYINSGFVNNKGIEVFSRYRIIQSQDFNLSASFNFTRQWSTVEEISEDIDIIVQGGAAGVSIVARLDDPAGIILGTAFDRDEQGRIILDSESLPRLKTSEDGAIRTDNIIGNSIPDILWGFATSMNYKGIFLGLHIDSKLGHDIFSVTNMQGAEFGTLAFTEQGRDEWYRALEISQITGTPPTDGYMVSGVKDGVEGEYPVDPQKYWDRLSRIHEAFIYNASYIRFREISIGYVLPQQMMTNMPFREVSVSLFANNLFYIMRHTQNISPESSFGTGNNLGFEMYAYPEMRSFGLNLKVSI